MALLGWLISRVAVVLLREDWARLRSDIVHLHTLHCRDTSCAPPRIVQAFLLSAEDHRFFKHRGVDPIAVARASWRNLMFGRKEGASTVEMQLVRVLTGRFDRTVSRKIREAAFATLLGSVVPRADIPAMYLRVAYYGTGMVGFSSACERLSMAPHSLTDRQAASVVARLKYPEPICMNEAARARIDMRTQHLLRVYARHASSRIHHGLVGEPQHASV